MSGQPPDEVVTHTLAHDVALPRGGGTLVLLTLDNGQEHRRPNSLGVVGLTELEAAISTALERDDVTALAITGKPYSFAAGADVTAMPFITTRDQARSIARRGHAVFAKLSTADKPTFAFVNGVALGGGLELALHCRYRTIATNVAAVGLPEVSLGLVPGWGGAYLLPRLIGVEKATQVIVANPLQNNRMLSGPAAAELGIADAAFDPADFLERSLEWVAAVCAGLEVARPDVTTERFVTAMVVGGARALLQARTHGASPAAMRALDLIEAAPTRTPESAYAAEDEALADLLMSPQFRAGIYAFDLVQRRAKRPAGAPDPALGRPVTKVGVVGGGLMGSQLALLLARRLEVPVVVVEVDADRARSAVERVDTEARRTVERKRMSPATAAAIAARVSGTTDLADLADADLVIEAVLEEPALKAAVFADLEKHVRPDCLLVTNTSALSLAAMAAGLRHPERVAGLHFFNPVAVMPLVEVVRAPQTDEATLATAFAVAKAARKSAVGVADAPGFVVNRLLTITMGGVLSAIDQGADVRLADAALDPLGLPMSTLELVELVGPAVAYHVGETLHAAFPERFGVSALLAAMVERGLPAVWAKPPRSDDPLAAAAPRRMRPEAAAMLEDLRAAGTLPPLDPAWTAERIRTETLGALAAEVGRMLEEGVVADVRDIDLGMLLGAGWPFWLGGITPYLDREGISERWAGRRFLPPGVASLPAER